MIGLLGIVILLLLMFALEMPVGFAMGIVGLGGICYVLSWEAGLGVSGNGDLGNFFQLRPHRDPHVHTHGADLLLFGCERESFQHGLQMDGPREGRIGHGHDHGLRGIRCHLRVEHRHCRDHVLGCTSSDAKIRL